jgi:phage gp29-like protein
MAEQKVEKPVLDEAAGLEKTDITAGYLGGKIYQNPDETLLRQGGGLGMQVYERVLRDPHVFSDYQKRFLSVTGKERQVLPGSDSPVAKQAAKLAEEILSAIPLFDQVLFGLLHGVHYGFRMAEIMWEYSEGQVWIGNVICRRPRYFAFDIHGAPRLLTINNPIYGEELPERKMQRFIYPGGDDNPYGEGLAQRLYWWDWFKKNNVKFWVLFNERFGSPLPVGKYPSGASEPQKTKLMNVLKSIQQETGVTIPEDQAIDFLEAQRSSTVNTYQDFLNYCDGQISKCIVGQTLTTQVGDTGSYAASKTHKEVKDEIVKADADLLCFYLNNELLRWAIDYNIPNLKRDDYPKLWIKCEEGDDLDARIARDEKICKMVPVPQSFIYETYDVPRPEGDEAVVEVKADPAPGFGGEPPVGADLRVRPKAEFAETSQAAISLQETYTQKSSDAYAQLMADVEQQLERAGKQ